MNELERLKHAIYMLKKSKIVKTQEEIAERIGYNKSSISEILNGKTPISDKFIQIFCSEFGVNKDYIQNNTGNILTLTNNTMNNNEHYEYDELFEDYQLQIQVNEKVTNRNLQLRQRIRELESELSKLKPKNQT